MDNEMDSDNVSQAETIPERWEVYDDNISEAETVPERTEMEEDEVLDVTDNYFNASTSSSHSNHIQNPLNTNPVESNDGDMEHKRIKALMRQLIAIVSTIEERNQVFFNYLLKNKVERVKSSVSEVVAAFQSCGFVYLLDCSALFSSMDCFSHEDSILKQAAIASIKLYASLCDFNKSIQQSNAFKMVEIRRKYAEEQITLLKLLRDAEVPETAKFRKFDVAITVKEREISELDHKKLLNAYVVANSDKTGTDSDVKTQFDRLRDDFNRVITLYKKPNQE